MTLSIEPILHHTCQLGEGPVWDVERQEISWLDILNGLIHFYSPSKKTFHTINVNQYVGSIVACKDGRLLGALQHGFAYIDRETGKTESIADPEESLPDNRFNDGKCDPAGRFWAGTMSHNDQPHAGTLYTLEKDLTIIKKIERTTISNGMAWNGDETKFYHIDTPTLKVSAYDYNNETGAITNKKTAISIPDEDGYPDGMTIDEDDMLWIAHWSGGQLTRWDPRTGKKLLHIKMPVTRITCCTFGGENFEDLYVTTARKDLTEAEIKKQPLSGSLFVIKNCGFRGRAAYRFG